MERDAQTECFRKIKEELRVLQQKRRMLRIVSKAVESRKIVTHGLFPQLFKGTNPIAL